TSDHHGCFVPADFIEFRQAVVTKIGTLYPGTPARLASFVLTTAHAKPPNTSADGSGGVALIHWPTLCLLLQVSSLCVCRAPTRMCRMRKDQILPQQHIIVRPFCDLCKAHVWLASIKPHTPYLIHRPFSHPQSH